MNNSKSLILELRLLRENKKHYSLSEYHLRLMDIREKMVLDITDVPLTEREENNYKDLLNLL